MIQLAREVQWGLTKIIRSWKTYFDSFDALYIDFTLIPLKWCPWVVCLNLIMVGKTMHTNLKGDMSMMCLQLVTAAPKWPKKSYAGLSSPHCYSIFPQFLSKLSEIVISGFQGCVFHCVLYFVQICSICSVCVPVGAFCQ